MSDSLSRDDAGAPADMPGVPTPPIACPEPRDAGFYWRQFRRLGPAGPLAVVAASLPAIAGFTLLGLIYWIAPWLRSQPYWGPLVYIGAFILCGGIALLPTWAYSVLGGWAFGFPAGFAAVMCAIIGASTVAYAVGRWAAGNRVLTMIDEHPKTRAVCRALLGSGFARSLLIVTLVRLSPNSPFAVTNLAFAAAKVNFVAYILGTMIGIAPRTGIVAYLASRLAEPRFDTPKWMMIGGILVTVIVLSIIAQLARRALAQVTLSPPA
jgi:uncharacterized membrane protein YdjX (TVP38/TMEM64 family)